VGPRGPLAGLKVIELGGIGPGPFAAMLLADLGAEVVRIDREAPSSLPLHRDRRKNLLLRGRRSLGLDLKDAGGRAVLLEMVERADALIDPFRPGVAERLGIGPEQCAQRNQGLVYARVTGWGQTGPLAERAGHDLNYVARAGPLAANGRRELAPAPILPNLADFGAGGALVAFGIVCAVHERHFSGLGQTIDAAMVDGVAMLFSNVLSYWHMGLWGPDRESNVLDGGAHYYNCYETRDGGYVTVAAMEPVFYRVLLETLELDPEEWPQDDRSRWPELKARLAELFRQRDRDEWSELFEGTDACVAAVLTLEEAIEDEHLRSRETYIEVDGQPQAAPVPRFSRTPGAVAAPPSLAGEHSSEVLADWGFAAAEIEELVERRVVFTSDRRPPD
jgi:alpha-methylacyl-CoA racemase